VISQYYTAQSVIRMQAEYTSKYHYMLPKVGLPAVVNLLTETGLDPSLFKLQAEIGQQTIAASMLASTKTLVLTHADATLAKQMARRWFSPSVLRDLEIEAVLPTLSIENVPRHKRPGGRCNFFHGGTFEAKRHLPALAAMTTQLVSMGKKCKLLLTTQNADVPDWLVGKEKFSEVVYNCGREEFLKQLQFGDFALCYIEYEGTGLATTEAIVSGMTPIVMWKPWNKGRFPEDYPFYCQGETEFAQAMHFCASDPKKAKEIGKQAVEHTRRIYSAESLGMQWSSILSDCLRKRNEETLARCSKHFMTGVIDTAIAKLKPIGSKQEALQAIASCSQSMEAKKLGQVWPQIRAVLSAFGCTFKTDDAGEELVVAP
jgi:hypothetical protein